MVAVTVSHSNHSLDNKLGQYCKHRLCIDRPSKSHLELYKNVLCGVYAFQDFGT